jgi:hypothetical protein
MLKEIHKSIYGDQEVASINTFKESEKEKYILEAQQTFFDNPIFNTLSQKYTLKDLSSDNKITLDSIYDKYVYIYIYLDLIYKHITASKNNKWQAIKNIKYLGSFPNIFYYVKIITLWLGIIYFTYIPLKIMNKMTNPLFLMLNIFEAVVEDLIKLRLKNAYVGLVLILTLPFNMIVYPTDQNINIINKMGKEWVILYTSWNANFCYGNLKNIGAGICLLNSSNSYNNDKLSWDNNRLYTLYTYGLLLSSKFYKNNLDSTIITNPLLLKDWDNLNVEYTKVLFKN